MLLICTAMWVLAYGLTVLKTYALGVYPDGDKAWRVGMGLFTAALCAASFLGARRRDRLRRMGEDAAAVVILLLVCAALVAGGVVLGVFSPEPRY